MKTPQPHSNSTKVAISSAFDSINKDIKIIKSITNKKATVVSPRLRKI